MYSSNGTTQVSQAQARIAHNEVLSAAGQRKAEKAAEKLWKHTTTCGAALRLDSRMLADPRIAAAVQAARQQRSRAK